MTFEPLFNPAAAAAAAAGVDANDGAAAGRGFSSHDVFFADDKNTSIPYQF